MIRNPRNNIGNYLGPSVSTLVEPGTLVASLPNPMLQAKASGQWTEAASACSSSIFAILFGRSRCRGSVAVGGFRVHAI